MPSFVNWCDVPVAAGTRLIVLISLIGLSTHARIPAPDDAPKPLSPTDSAAKAVLPDGFSLQLVASEPLVKQPSAVCWDARGRLLVCELHGYNMEGQYDIEELNKSGKLDRKVRRMSAPPEAVKKGEADQIGVVKLLRDTDGDGVMDKADVWADDLPACIGIVPARDGVIVVAAPHIIFLADRDGDGRAEVRERLYSGFGLGPLERRINTPRRGPDGWIYVGRGKRCRITGPKLKAPVNLPDTDFRIKADGSAIEPISGGTWSIGWAALPSGQRFVGSTSRPGNYVAPLAWRYLARNPDVKVGRLNQGATDYNNLFAVSQPHPWRLKRQTDKAFFEFYNKRYGDSESVAAGFFTAGCSPLVYQDDALPGLKNAYLMCEPATNLVHRADIVPRGAELLLRRPEAYKDREFLASSDIWFHPISLSHTPDGSLAIVDFYREIIEDYSAIPRYLQQQYGLKNGRDHGRIWRLVHKQMPAAPKADMSGLGDAQLTGELASPLYWRRDTARRLLRQRIESGQRFSAEQVTALNECLAGSADGAINALHLLAADDRLSPAALSRGLQHSDYAARVNALALSEPWLDRSPPVLDSAIALANDEHALVRLQLLLSLGESRSAAALGSMLAVANADFERKWVTLALHSSIGGRETEALRTALRGKARAELLAQLCRWLADRRNPAELAVALELIAAQPEATRSACLRGLRRSIDKRVSVQLPESGSAALATLSAGSAESAKTAQQLQQFLRPESAEQRRQRISGAAKRSADATLPTTERLGAIRELVADSGNDVSGHLIAAFATGAPSLRAAIVDTLLGRPDRVRKLLDAVEAKQITPAALSGVSRQRLLQHADTDTRARATRLLAGTTQEFEKTFEPFRKALAGKRDIANGKQVFANVCGSCHQAHGVGIAIGPDLSAEMKRAEETILKDILAPSSSITAGYSTYVVETKDGSATAGLLISEAPGNLTIKDAAGTTHVVARKSIVSLKALDVSLMPEGLGRALGPKGVADLIAWLRQRKEAK